MARNFLIVDPEEGQDVLRAFASPARARILRLLRQRGPLNVNEIAAGLGPAAVVGLGQRAGAGGGGADPLPRRSGRARATRRSAPPSSTRCW